MNINSNLRKRVEDSDLFAESEIKSQVCFEDLAEIHGWATESGKEG